MNARGRPRIPTPDVQKDGVVDKDSKQNMPVNGSVQPGTYPSDIPIVQVNDDDNNNNGFPLPK